MKKYILFLLFLSLMVPLGIGVPALFHAAGAWGEWPVETVRRQTGIEPAGMKIASDLYRAPFPEYGDGKSERSLARQSVQYVFSAFIGLGIIAILTFGIRKFYH